MNHVHKMVQNDQVGKNDQTVMWTGYFSHQADDGCIKPTIEICTVPYFQEKAAAMIKYTFDVHERNCIPDSWSDTYITYFNKPLYDMGNTSYYANCAPDD